MKVLLDTCILAELQNHQGHPAVKEIVMRIDEDSLFLSALTVGEIAKGIALLAPGKKKQALSHWFNSLEAQFASRILPIETETARMWGELTARAQQKGITIPAVDGLLAATALRYGMHIMTRNTRHFEASGAIIIDPFK
jgi:predicted nucleic acid-binding protein